MAANASRHDPGWRPRPLDRVLHPGAGEVGPAPRGRGAAVVVGDGDEATQAVLERTHDRDAGSDDLGSGCAHAAVEVDDAHRACEEAPRRGGKGTRPAGPMTHGTTVIASVEDPDGDRIEFVGR